VRSPMKDGIYKNSWAVGWAYSDDTTHKFSPLVLQNCCSHVAYHKI
jgi:hypothetical protein